jgi:bifunctional enzyme CysN/CysC
MGHHDQVALSSSRRRAVQQAAVAADLTPAPNTFPPRCRIGKEDRALALGQRPTVVWLTGISAAGKSTIANLVEQELHDRGHHTYLLDGDRVRCGLNADLGFTEPDRLENVRRVAEVSHLLLEAGLIVLVAFISPFRRQREAARALFEPGEFVEVFVDVPLEVAEGRDPKGLYEKARRGEIPNFTGIDSPYEPPDSPDLRIDTTRLSADDAAGQVLRHLEETDRIAVKRRR